jgi:uncharacterized protein (DUF488 family)
VRALVDVRSVPRSRRHPEFAREPLSEALRAHGISYSHAPDLGGFRKPTPGSVNTGWTHPAFQGYADHMASPEFVAALRRLEDRARERRSCIMCAEAQWWRCHRRLIADALLIRGWRVLHLGLRREPVDHELTPFAVIADDGTLSYPHSQETLRL